MVLQVDKDWLVPILAVALLTNGQFISTWDAEAPDPDKILKTIEKMQKTKENFAFIINKSFSAFGIIIRR